ncbi:hypothetical protein, partial [Stella sp.]|uniref:hypothetical protein n=1 Tax=Stella sp. TaxID=2912054 RepID=UPI0035B465DE
MTNHPGPGRRALFSVCAPNYLARVATLMESAARLLPDHDRHVVLAVERPAPGDAATLPGGTRLRTPAEAGVPDLDVRRRLYNVTEFCTAIKPDLILSLWAEGYDEVLYFDPDIVLFVPPSAIAAAWEAGAEVVLTPHLLTGGDHPDWVMRAVSLSGQYNLGFIGLRAGP